MLFTTDQQLKPFRNRSRRKCLRMAPAMVSGIIIQTLTCLCPIAAMFADVGEVTAKHRIIRN